MTENCPFCIVADQIQYSNDSAISIFDKYPITEHHCLVIPKRHKASFFTLDPKEQQDCIDLINLVKLQLCDMDETITGFNLGINDGVDADKPFLIVIYI